MASFLRLRQICLVAADLARETERLSRRSSGWRNATATSMSRNTGSRTCCSRSERISSKSFRRRVPAPPRAVFSSATAGATATWSSWTAMTPSGGKSMREGLGVRIANLIRHGDYLGVQLHPKDTGARDARIQPHDRRRGSARPLLSPAGPGWQRAIRENVTRRLLAAEIECPDARRFAARWGEILERPVQDIGAASYRIALDSGVINFLPDRFAGGRVVRHRTAGRRSRGRRAAAQARGCAPGDGTVKVCGVRFRLSA